ncbi:hypothetical protein RDB90_003053 [Salmonella enterica]|nr:hypothetical protein [Salmonella enterica]
MKEILTKEQARKISAGFKGTAHQISKALTESAEIIEEITSENIELRDQLASYESPDYLAIGDLVAELKGAYPTKKFTSGDRISLKHRPEITGTIEGCGVSLLVRQAVIAYDVRLDHYPSETLPIITTALELLPEADDPKQ